MTINIWSDGIPEPIWLPTSAPYKGWIIWAWTGWKGEKSKARCSTPITCPTCAQPFVVGQDLYRTQSQVPHHWTCHYPDNRPDRLVGQWCAVLLGPTPSQHRFVQSSAGTRTPPHEYQKGASFDIGDDRIITEHSSESEKEAEKQRAFRELKLWIDREVGF